ncbi:MAG: pyridoxine 5'-phosphate synthase, partial [Candidatus Omnitrophica bacterium]|nr:pyridoxine 5'-phosphate synthase [Candidatus Omnitrophota bacterium]
SIVCHLREDRRHIQDQDVERLRRTVTTRLNLEMSIAAEIVERALAVRPDQVTLVPERRQELTTEGGLDVVRLSKRLRPVIQAFHAREIAVSLFIDPAPAQVEAAREAGAAVIELHTGRYANATAQRARARELALLRRAAAKGRALGLVVAAGHGLDYDNVQPVAAIPEVEELNIGFAIISRALFVGLGRRGACPLPAGAGARRRGLHAPHLHRAGSGLCPRAAAHDAAPSRGPVRREGSGHQGALAGGPGARAGDEPGRGPQRPARPPLHHAA